MKERRLFSRHSIGTRIAALFMLLILVITAVMTYVSISVLTNELLDNATEYTEQLIRRVNAELDMYVEYSGTAYSDILQHSPINDVDAVYNTVKTEFKEKYNVMSVPCLVINQDKVTFGKKNIQQLLEVIGTGNSNEI